MSDEEEQKLMLFGRDLLKIPCFRRSFLYGVGSGVGIGLVTFLFTSRANLAVNIAMGSYLTITTCVFLHCRYDYYKLRMNAAYARQVFRQEGLWKDTASLLDEEDIKKEEA